MILELLLAAGAEVALKKAISTIAGFAKADRLGRLLLLFNEDFGDEADLNRSAFLSWRTDEDLSKRLLAVARGGGAFADEAALADAIAPHLVRTDEEHRRELANRMAKAARQFAPLVVADLAESTQLITNRLEAHASETRAGLEALNRAFAASEHEAGLAEALLRGPLDHARARSLVERSQALAEDDRPAEAAAELLEACRLLDEKGLDVISEGYRARAGELLVAAGDHSGAALAFEQAALGQLARGSSLAALTIRKFAGLAHADDRWRVDALQSRLAWMADSERTRSALEAAAERDPEIWLAELVEYLVLMSSWDAVLERTGDLAAITDASRGLRAKLARAEALSATADTRAEDYWGEVLAQADAQGAKAAGLAQQRRAMRLAFDDHPEAASDAYTQAMERWGGGADGAEQLAESFYGALAAAMTGALRTSDQDLVPLAAEMRGSTSLPAARAERLEYHAMTQRISGRLREALISYGHVLRIHRLSGSLMGWLTTEERFAELLNQAERPKLAVSHYLHAGKAKEALRVAGAVREEELEDVVELDGPGWERAATYELIERIGGSLSDEWVAQNVDRMLADAERPARPWLGPDPRSASRSALAAVALQVPEGRRDEIAAILRIESHTGLPGSRIAAGRALVLGTNAGLWDATLEATELFLAEPQLSGVEIGWIAERANDSLTVRDLLVREAKTGSRPALEALGIAQIDPDAELQGVANERLEAVGSLKAVEHGNGQVRIGMGAGLAGLGSVASLADSSHAEDLASDLLDLIVDPEELEVHRASGAEALLMMLDSLEKQTVRRIVEVASPLALGEYEPSPWDRSEVDPLSAFRFALHTPHALQATALRLVASAEAWIGAEPDSVVPRAIENALQSGDATLMIGGLEAAAASDADATGEAVVAASKHPQVAVRHTALRTLSAINALPRAVLERLSKDDAPTVRKALLDLDLPTDDEAWVRHVLEKDPHAYVRALARRQEPTK